MYRLYQAAFDRNPDAEDLGYWLDFLDRGVFDLDDIAGFFIDSVEFARLYGDPDTVTDADYVELLYLNVLDREPDQLGFDYWLERLNEGSADQVDLLVLFSESVENKLAVFGRFGGAFYANSRIQNAGIK